MSTRISRDTESALQAHARKSHLDTSYQEAWRNLPELPSADEIKPPRDEFDAANYQQEEWNDYQHDPLYDPKLPKNRIEGSWPTKEAYIGTHYQILREDAVAPLRNSVAAVHKCPTMEDDGDTCIYTHVSSPPPKIKKWNINIAEGYFYRPPTQSSGCCIPRRILHRACWKADPLGAVQALDAGDCSGVDTGARHVYQGRQDCSCCRASNQGRARSKSAHRRFVLGRLERHCSRSR